MSEMMDVSESLRKIANELVELAIDIDETQGLRSDFTERFGGATFMLKWIADGLDKELERGQERADKIKDRSGNWSYYTLGTCGPNGCFNVPG